MSYAQTQPPPGFRKVELTSAEGEHVTYGLMPDFETAPAVLTWGHRTFLTDGARPAAQDPALVYLYRECFAAALVQPLPQEAAPGPMESRTVVSARTLTRVALKQVARLDPAAAESFCAELRGAINPHYVPFTGPLPEEIGGVIAIVVAELGVRVQELERAEGADAAQRFALGIIERVGEAMAVIRSAKGLPPVSAKEMTADAARQDLLQAPDARLAALFRAFIEAGGRFSGLRAVDPELADLIALVANADMAANDPAGAHAPGDELTVAFERLYAHRFDSSPSFAVRLLGFVVLVVDQIAEDGGLSPVAAQAWEQVRGELCITETVSVPDGELAPAPSPKVLS